MFEKMFVPRGFAVFLFPRVFEGVFGDGEGGSLVSVELKLSLGCSVSKQAACKDLLACLAN
jgi:hypothetical protein